MKSKLSFSWHEKSFFLIGLMTATLFFVWAGMLQAPKSIYSAEAGLNMDEPVTTPATGMGSLTTSDPFGCFILSLKPHEVHVPITFLAGYTRRTYHIIGWDAGPFGDPDPRVGGDTEEFTTTFAEAGSYTVKVFFSRFGQREIRQATCTVSVTHFS